VDVETLEEREGGMVGAGRGSKWHRQVRRVGRAHGVAQSSVPRFKQHLRRILGKRLTWCSKRGQKGEKKNGRNQYAGIPETKKSLEISQRMDPLKKTKGNIKEREYPFYTPGMRKRSLSLMGRKQDSSPRRKKEKWGKKPPPVG